MKSDGVPLALGAAGALALAAHLSGRGRGSAAISLGDLEALIARRRAAEADGSGEARAPQAPPGEVAISMEALPQLRHQYRLAVARCRAPLYRKLCGDEVFDLRAQILAAKAGAPTWTDARGTIWGPRRTYIGGAEPLSGAWHGGAGF